MFGDLQNPRLIWMKGGLMLVVGLLATSLLLYEAKSLRVALLHGLAVWGFCRSYYFAFYVIQHYVDPQYKFAGLIDFMRYAMGRPRRS